jgi:hypothetical protein
MGDQAARGETLNKKTPEEYCGQSDKKYQKAIISIEVVGIGSSPNRAVRRQSLSEDRPMLRV